MRKVPGRRDLFVLGKVPIAFLSTLSLVPGYLMAGGDDPLELAVLLVGVFLLAAGAGALNHFQDGRIDSRLERTRRRPLPAGRVEGSTVLVMASSLILAGLSVLGLQGGRWVLALGAGALFWYNGLYAVLKRVSAYAVIPGALVGAVPPALGWVAAGGSLADRPIQALCLFFFLWQVPHFWLLLLKYREDYLTFPLPSPLGRFGTAQLERMTFGWVGGTALAAASLPLYGAVRSLAPALLLGLAALALVLRAWSLLARGGDGASYGKLFREINLYALFVISLLSLEPLWG